MTSTRLGELLRLRQLDRHELAHAALGHGDAEQAVHARHGDGIVGDGDEAGVGALAHGLEQVAEALDIIVVERRVDLVEHADRRRVGEEHGEDERKRGQRLLAAGEKGQRLRLLARRLGEKLESRLERIVGFDQLQFRLAALEQGREQILEMAVDDIESGDEPLAPLLIERANRAAQALDRFGQIVALGDELVAGSPEPRPVRRRRAG